MAPVVTAIVHPHTSDGDAAWIASRKELELLDGNGTTYRSPNHVAPITPLLLSESQNAPHHVEVTRTLGQCQV